VNIMREGGAQREGRDFSYCFAGGINLPSDKILSAPT